MVNCTQGLMVWQASGLRQFAPVWANARKLPYELQNNIRNRISEIFTCRTLEYVIRLLGIASFSSMDARLVRR